MRRAEHNAAAQSDRPASDRADKHGGEATAIDRSQPAPLYLQIFLQLREEITSGERAHGSRMPTEMELAAQFNVSRITARRVLDELADINLVARKRRVGTRVVFKAPAKPLKGPIEEIDEQLINFGPPSKIKLLEVGLRAVKPPVDEALRIEPLTEVLRLVRVQSVGGVPLGHFVIYIPPAAAEGVTRARLASASLSELLNDAGVRLGGARQTISATLADAALSAALKVSLGSPLLRVSRTLLDRTGRPVQHILARIRPDQHQVSIELDIRGRSILLRR